MSYSYQKQIERLLAFVKEVGSFGCVYGGDACSRYDDIDPCFRCKANKLLNDEPVNSKTTFGCLENPERPNKPEGLNPSMGERWF